MTSEPSATVTAALDSAQTALFRWDLVTDAFEWLFLPKALADIPGLKDVKTGAALNKSIAKTDLSERLTAVTRHVHKQGPLTCEYALTTGPGESIRLRETGQVRYKEDGKTPASIQGILTLVCAQTSEALQQAEQQQYDSQTGVYLKERLYGILEQALFFSERYKQQGAYLAIGIDTLSMINDAYGYAAGDAVVLKVCERLQECLRASDALGRIEGDRLGIVLAQVTKQEAKVLCQRLVDSINVTPIETEEGPLHVSISIGAVIFPEHASKVFECVVRADNALVQAKTSGRNCYVLYAYDSMARAGRRQIADMNQRIRSALRENELCLAFQPILEAKSHKPVLYESLLRIQDKEKGIMSAGDFIRVAEQSGIIRQIDLHVLELIMQELIESPKVQLAFNISGLTAGDSRWLDVLRSYVKGKPELAERLIVEITETAAMAETPETLSFVRTLRDLGCHVALDDFGAGYTSFRHLKALPVDYMKIDGSFVRNYVEGKQNQLFVRTLLELADAFNLITVAEGIETEEQCKAMESEGVHLLQGYYFSKPSVKRPWQKKESAA